MNRAFSFPDSKITENELVSQGMASSLRKLVPIQLSVNSFSMPALPQVPSVLLPTPVSNGVTDELPASWSNVLLPTRTRPVRNFVTNSGTNHKIINILGKRGTASSLYGTSDEFRGREIVHSRKVYKRELERKRRDDIRKELRKLADLLDLPASGRPTTLDIIREAVLKVEQVLNTTNSLGKEDAGKA